MGSRERPWPALPHSCQTNQGEQKTRSSHFLLTTLGVRPTLRLIRMAGERFVATAAGSSNKAKIAKRVIEVLEFFDDNHREATVMDIVRRYDRPQSSTSELLSSLVELGLLYKDPYSRSYSLTPRAALLGTAGQEGPVRDGRLVKVVDR